MSLPDNPVFDLLDTLGLAEDLAEGLQQEGPGPVIVQVSLSRTTPQRRNLCHREHMLSRMSV